MRPSSSVDRPPGAADLVFWTSHLSDYALCPHLASLTYAAWTGAGPRPPQYDDPGAEVLRRKGDEHEQRVLARYRERGLGVARSASPPAPEDGGPEPRTPEHHAAAAAATVEAMRAGHDVVFQGTLFDGTWLGRTDFLRRVERPSPVLGDWSYEVVDAKLAREPKGSHLLQIALYSDLLARAQGLEPEQMHLVLGGPEPREQSFRTADYAAYYRLVRRRFDAHIAAQAESIERARAGGDTAAVHAEAMGRTRAGGDAALEGTEAGAQRSVGTDAASDHDASGRPASGRPAGATAPAALTTYPEPCDHCVVCDWKTVCRKRWTDDDHLSLVAGIARRQRDELEERGIGTLEALGDAPIPLDPPLASSSPTVTERVQRQARIQLEARRAGPRETRYEFLTPVVANEGLAALPEPSPGDLFLDFESDRFHEHIGLEYLLGYCEVGGAETYTPLWALDRAREKVAFERFMDLVAARRQQYPDLHVYHYAAYEETALKRLSLRHSTRVEEVDDLLRGNVLVDLFRVVRQGIRASVESYSIKKLEPFYGLERDVDLRDASSALQQFEAFLELPGDDAEAEAVRARIEGYNRDDCVSTLRLREWLEGLREELAAETGKPVPRFAPKEDPGPEKEPNEIALRVAELETRLTADIPDDAIVAGPGAGVLAEADGTTPLPGPDGATSLTPDQAARLLLARLLDFHRREDKALWWEYFARCAMSEDELIEDRSCLGALRYQGEVDKVERSIVHRYRFPEQEHELSVGDQPHAAELQRFVGTIVAVDDRRRTVDIKRRAGDEMPARMSLVPHERVPAEILRDSLLRLAEAVLEEGLGDGDRTRLAADLLQRRLPRIGGRESGESPGPAESGPLIRTDEDELATARRLVMELDRSVLAIQGPPGSGKTYTGARMIADLLAARRRVGITATSHKVIGNLLTEVCDVARERGLAFRGIQKATERQGCGHELVELAGKPEGVAAALVAAREEGEACLAAGTAWLWANEKLTASVDVLVVDEAGQFSLANALAVAPAAGSLVLLGDPQQLEQPIRGIHPEGAGASALDHLLAGAPTIASEQGLFLAHTWRLHPDICAFTSEQFYAGRLEPQKSLHRQRVDGPAPIDGTGLRLVSVEHTGNRNHSPEEVKVVARLVDELLAAGATWTDREGGAYAVGLEDILIVAPYNAHVDALEEALPAGARVGTVDRFQGQEAPVVIYSMATSRPEDAPRGMEFLYNASRLNVATSRARCLAVIVASPALLEPACRTPRQMWLANGYARVGELAE